MPTHKLRKVRKRLEDMGATFQARGGRKHGTVRLNGRVARWPNPHDDPIDDFLLNSILSELSVDRDEFFKRKPKP